jgi:hypothetical protein
MSAITVKKEGTRVYFEGNTFAVKDRIKSIGGRWDGDSKRWWVGAVKLDAATKLAEELSAPVPAAAADAPAGEEGEPDSTRVLGKVKYKGRSFYLLAETADLTRCRIATLKGKAFWADCSACSLEKRYQPRERWNGVRGRGSKQVMVHQTLGSIRSFIAKQDDPRTRRGECTECGHWGPSGETCSECCEGVHVDTSRRPAPVGAAAPESNLDAIEQAAAVEAFDSLGMNPDGSFIQPPPAEIAEAFAGLGLDD